MKPLSCKETTRLVSQGLDRELGFGERVALRVHCNPMGRFVSWSTLSH